jgi:hypothetical protein
LDSELSTPGYCRPVLPPDVVSLIHEYLVGPMPKVSRPRAALAAGFVPTAGAGAGAGSGDLVRPPVPYPDPDEFGGGDD